MMKGLMSARSQTFDRRTVRRIHIIGGPASGKTALARRLGASLDLPVYHLDTVCYEGPLRVRRDLETRSADVSRIASEAAWIAEGTHIWWTDELLRRAEMIVWLDIPGRIALWRIILRHFEENHLSIRRGLQLRKLLGDLRLRWRYYHGSILLSHEVLGDDAVKNRVTTAQYLASYADKLICCRSGKDVEVFLTTIEREKHIGA